MITTCEYTVVNGRIVPVYNDPVHECKCYIDERGYTRLVEDKVMTLDEAMDKYPEEFI